jgi:hypothetical protein
LYLILGNTFPFVVRESHVELRDGISLISGKQKPLERFGIVLGDTSSKEVIEAQSFLRGGISLASSFF